MVIVANLKFALVSQLAMVLLLQQLAMVGALLSIHVFMWKFTFALVSKTQLLEAMSAWTLRMFSHVVQTAPALVL